MSNLSVSLTFSDDGEFLQLSRMDAAILLTWIMGGDHDNEPEPKPAAKPTTPTAKTEYSEEAPRLQAPPVTPTPMPATQAPPMERRVEPPIEKTPLSKAPIPPLREKVEIPEQRGLLPKMPLQRESAPPTSKKSAAAQIIKESVPAPALPFSIVPNSAEFSVPPAAPTANELLEEEPYWDYGDAPTPTPKL